MKGAYQVCAGLHGENIKGSPFELRAHCVSAEQSFVQVTDSPFFFSDSSLTITAVDQDGTPLTQGGDEFTARIITNELEVRA